MQKSSPQAGLPNEAAESTSARADTTLQTARSRTQHDAAIQPGWTAELRRPLAKYTANWFYPWQNSLQIQGLQARV